MLEDGACGLLRFLCFTEAGNDMFTSWATMGKCTVPVSHEATGPTARLTRAQGPEEIASSPEQAPGWLMAAGCHPFVRREPARLRG